MKENQLCIEHQYALQKIMRKINTRRQSHGAKHEQSPVKLPHALRAFLNKIQIRRIRYNMWYISETNTYFWMNKAMMSTEIKCFESTAPLKKKKKIWKYWWKAPIKNQWEPFRSVIISISAVSFRVGMKYQYQPLRFVSKSSISRFVPCA